MIGWPVRGRVLPPGSQYREKHPMTFLARHFGLAYSHD